MKIVVLTGSPHENGTTAAMAEAFIRGAGEAGHDIFRFDAAKESVHGCIACDCCEQGEHPCVFDDDMKKLVPHLISADLVVFVSPVYYCGFSSQIKSVIDRFYGIDKKLCGASKSSILLAAAADTEARNLRGMKAVYEEAIHYLKWKDLGQICAKGCAAREDIENSMYLNDAYQLGKTL